MIVCAHFTGDEIDGLKFHVAASLCRGDPPALISSTRRRSAVAAIPE
jgi:hypothetical protein